jgi:hypothetical protein
MFGRQRDLITVVAASRRPPDHDSAPEKLVRRAAEPGWWQVQGARLPKLWQELIDFERSATAIINYEPLVVPGLLHRPPTTPGH